MASAGATSDPPAALVKLNTASILREAEVARRQAELEAALQEEPGLEEARRIEQLAAMSAAQSERVAQRRHESRQAEESLRRLRQQAQERNAQLVATVRAERRATLERLHQQKEADELEARHAREQVTSLLFSVLTATN